MKFRIFTITAICLAFGLFSCSEDEESSNKESKEKTGFCTHKGLYQFEVMPFGLASAPSVFCKLMERVFEGLDFVKVYINDVIISSKTKEDHLKHI